MGSSYAGTIHWRWSRLPALFDRHASKKRKIHQNIITSEIRWLRRKRDAAKRKFGARSKGQQLNALYRQLCNRVEQLIRNPVKKKACFPAALRGVILKNLRRNGADSNYRRVSRQNIFAAKHGSRLLRSVPPRNLVCTSRQTVAELEIRHVLEQN